MYSPSPQQALLAHYEYICTGIQESLPQGWGEGREEYIVESSLGTLHRSFMFPPTSPDPGSSFSIYGRENGNQIRKSYSLVLLGTTKR